MSGISGGGTTPRRAERPRRVRYARNISLLRGFPGSAEPAGRALGTVTDSWGEATGAFYDNSEAEFISTVVPDPDIQRPVANLDHAKDLGGGRNADQ